MPEIIKSSQIFDNLISDLQPEERMAVIEVMRGKLPDLIKSEEDLYIVVRDLSLEECTALHDAMLEEANTHKTTPNRPIQKPKVNAKVITQQYKLIVKPVEKNTISLISSGFKLGSN